jgi:protocatechuate 3,4-dioxygenase beta subunit
MNRHRRSSFATSFGLALALLGWCMSSQTQDSGLAEITLATQFRIAGTVVNKISGAPLAQTRVTISDVKHPNAVRSMVTSENGHFEFSQVAPGKYSLQGSRRGFVGAAYDEHEQYSTAIVTGAGIDTENLILRLNPSALLSGTILDESGEPVRQSTVSLYRETHTAGISQVVQASGTTTDDLGSYEFPSLAPGNYFVSATAKPWYEVHPPSSGTEGTSDFPATVDRSLDVAYPATYYPDTTDPDQAPPIPLKGGDHLQIEIRLAPVPALHLRFRFSGDGQHGVAMPMLRRKAFDSEQYIPSDGLRSISPGVYELAGVPAGQYDVRVGAFGQHTQSNLDLVNDGQEVDAADLEPVSSIKATVQILGQKELPSQLHIVLSDDHRKVVASQNPDAKGELHFEGVEQGKYTVLAWDSGTAYAVTRISSQGADMPGHTLNVTTGSSPLEVSITLIAGTANVEGIASRAGKGSAGAMIVLVPDDPENHRELFRRDQSDLDGSFNLPSVVPGSYTILAIENGWDLDWSQPAVIMQYAKPAQSLKVTAQARGSVHVPAPVEIQSR